MKKNILKFTLYVTGAVILSLGIQLSILSKLGAAAYDAMNANLHRFLNYYLSPKITLGNTMMITTVILFIITMILKPRAYYFFGLLLGLFVSFMIDVFGSFIPAPHVFFLQVFYYLLALLTIAFGLALIIRSKLPMNSMDNLMMILTKKTKKPVGLIKTLLDVLYALLAILFGFLCKIGFGAVNLGTLIMALFTGTLINIFLKILKEIK
ncbi:MAG TPA: DUF6198 family protein [Bacilli bacterium]